MTEFKLAAVLEKRGMTLYRLAEITGAKYNSLLRLKRGTALSISFDLLDRICIALNCEPRDLFEFAPNGKPKRSR